MSEEAGLLKAIAAAPDEDKARLAYADWLNKNGDPTRADLIRLQCGLAWGRDWRSGKTAEGERLDELKKRQQDLITEMLAPREADEHQGIREFKTTPKIADIVSAEPTRVTFRRGMIRSLNLQGTQITTFPPNLLVDGNVNLRNTQIATLPPDLHICGSLDLTRTPITTLPLNFHVGRDLHLDFTRITTLPPGLHIAGNLSLYSSPVTNLPHDLHVGGNIDLTGTSLTEESARSILTMPNLSAEARITGLETAGFQALATMARRQAARGSVTGTPPRQ